MNKVNSMFKQNSKTTFDGYVNVLIQSKTREMKL